MAGDTTVTVIGNLTSDPELRFTPNGIAVATFTVASTPRTFDRQANEWKDGDTLFIRCELWREFAENAAESLTKGARVICQGRLVVRTYDRNDGSKGTSVELKDCEVGPSLRYATAQVQRIKRDGGQGGYASGGRSDFGSNNRGSNAPSGSGSYSAQRPAADSPQDDPWGSNSGSSAYDQDPPF